jgi:hypothetical protein
MGRCTAQKYNLFAVGCEAPRECPAKPSTGTRDDDDFRHDAPNLLKMMLSIESFAGDRGKDK